MKPLPPLTDNEKEYIEQNYSEKPVGKLHKELGLTFHQVRTYIEQTGVKKGRGSKPKMQFMEKKVPVYAYVKRKHFAAAALRLRLLEKEFSNY